MLLCGSIYITYTYIFFSQNELCSLGPKSRHAKVSLCWVWRCMWPFAGVSVSVAVQEGSDVADSGAADAVLCADWSGTELATRLPLHQTVCVCDCLCVWRHRSMVTVVKIVLKDRFVILNSRVPVWSLTRFASWKYLKECITLFVAGYFSRPLFSSTSFSTLF